MSRKESAMVMDLMGEMPDDFDVKTQAGAAVAGSLSIQDALGWLNQRGIAEAIVFDEDGQDVGMLDVESLLGDESLQDLVAALPAAAAFPEKYCPEDGVCMDRGLAEDDKNGKYYCPRHREYHCEATCP
jgi:hypothetical protein